MKAPYYIRYKEYQDSAMLRKHRSIYRQRIAMGYETPIELYRYGKNWRLMEEGMKITWPGVGDDLLYYLSPYLGDDKQIADIMIAGLRGQTIMIPLVTDVQIVDRLRSNGIIVEFNRCVGGECTDIRTAHNIISNATHPLTLYIENHMLIMEMLEVKNIPYIADFNSYYHTKESLYKCIKIFRFGESRNKMALLIILIQSNCHGHVQIGLPYFSQDELNVIIEQGSMVTSNIIMTIINNVQESQQFKLELFNKLIEVCSDASCLQSNPFEVEEIEGDELRYVEIVNDDLQLKECTNPKYRSYWSKYQSYNINLICFLCHLGIPFINPRYIRGHEWEMLGDYYNFMSTEQRLFRPRANTWSMFKMIGMDIVDLSKYYNWDYEILLQYQVTRSKNARGANL